MLPLEYKQIARRTYEAANARDLSVLDELFAPDFVNVTAGGAGVQTLEEMKASVAEVLAAFPDAQFTVDEQLADGDRVVNRFTFRGTHLGEFNGIPPTGKRVAIGGIEIYRFRDGRVTECVHAEDMLGLLRQLGVMGDGPGA
jgi:steroid delta-isomerase-like uncharacterized protein